MLVCDELGPDLILGADFISKTGIILDIHDKKYYFGFDRSQKYNFDDNTNNQESTGTTSTHLEHHESELAHLESKDRRKMHTLIEQFSNVLTPKLGLTNLIAVSYTHLDVYKRQLLFCCYNKRASSCA